MSNYGVVAILGCLLANSIVVIWLLSRMDKIERKYNQLKHLVGIQKVNAKHGTY